MKQIILALLCILMAAGAVQAQDVYSSSGNSKRNFYKKKEGFDPDRLIYGGGVGLSLGTYTAIGAAPVLGYKISDRFAAGVGFGYQYVSIRDYFEVYNPNTAQYDYYPYRSNFFYPSVWSRFLILENLFAHAEFEYDIQSVTIHENDRNSQSPTAGRYIKYKQKAVTQALLIGPGYRQPIGETSSLVIIGLYDVLQNLPQNKYSPYKGRIDIRIGFNIGF